MRDVINPNGLRAMINDIEDSFPYALKLIRDTKEKKVIERLKRMYFSDYLEKTIAHYSVGDDKQTVCNALLETITAFEEGFQWKGFKYSYGGYDNMIWMISIGILCDIAQTDFERITAILDRDGANDKLLSELIRYKQPSWQASTEPVIQEHPYASAVNLQTADDIKQYLNKIWYKGHSDAYWHDLHKNKDVNNYFGYWAWETAALVKIRNIDDQSLKDQKYYPYDAVHW